MRTMRMATRCKRVVRWIFYIYVLHAQTLLPIGLGNPWHKTFCNLNRPYKTNVKMKRNKVFTYLTLILIFLSQRPTNLSSCSWEFLDKYQSNFKKLRYFMKMGFQHWNCKIQKQLHYYLTIDVGPMALTCWSPHPTNTLDHSSSWI